MSALGRTGESAHGIPPCYFSQIHVNHNYLKTKSLLKAYNKDPVFCTISVPLSTHSFWITPVPASWEQHLLGTCQLAAVQVTTFLLQMTYLWECLSWLRLEIIFFVCVGEGQLVI